MRRRNLTLLLGAFLLLASAPAALAATPTHFVNATGVCSNSNAGTSSGAPWCNLDPIPAALASYAGNMVVQVTGPVPALPQNTLLAPPTGHTLTIQGDRPAVAATPTQIDGETLTIQQPANVGTRALVEPRASDGFSAVYGPTGGSGYQLPGSRFGAWQQVVVNGFTVWRAANIVSGLKVAAWSNGRETIPNRVPVWQTLPDVTTWTNAALGAGNTNLTWGVFADSSFTYLVPPPDGSFTNPNSVWIWTASGSLAANAIGINGPDVTITNLSFIALNGGVYIREGAVRAHIVGNDFRDYTAGVDIVSLCCTVYSQSHTVENNRFSDDGNWAEPGTTPVTGQVLSWNDFKMSQPYGGGVSCSCFRAQESVAILAQGGSNNSVYQNNTVWGGVDGFDHFPTPPGGGAYDEHSDAHLTIQNNYFTRLSDDAMDRTGNQEFLTISGNRADYTGTFISLAWTAYGPVTITNNRAFDTGAAARRGQTPPGYDFKMGSADGTSYVQPQVTVSGNSFWTDTPDTEAINPAGGTGANISKLLLDHNIFRLSLSAGGHIVKVEFAGQISEDYNDWSESSQTAANPFEMWNGNFDTITAWTAASGQGVHSNLRNPSLRAVPDAFLVDPSHGNSHVVLFGIGAS